MDGQDPDGGIVDLGEDGLGDPALLVGLGKTPVNEAAQRAPTGLSEGPGTVGQKADPTPDVAGPGLPEGDLQYPALVDQAFQDSGGSEEVAASVHLAQPGETRGHELDRLVAFRLVGLVVPGTAMVHPPAGEVIVSAAEMGRAECRHDGQVISGVVDGPQHHQQIPDLRCGEEQRAGFGPVGDAGGLQRNLQVGQ